MNGKEELVLFQRNHAAIWALGLLMLVDPSVAWADLTARVDDQGDRGYNIVLQNTGVETVTIRSAVINRKTSDPICNLMPVNDLDGRVNFYRSDTDMDVHGFGRTIADGALLDFGDETTLVVFRTCGRLLEFYLTTNTGSITFSSKE